MGVARLHDPELAAAVVAADRRAAARQGALGLAGHIDRRAVGAGLQCPPAAFGAGVGIGIIFGQGVQAIARQPEAYGVIRQNMILGFALAEALAIIGIALAFVL